MASTPGGMWDSVGREERNQPDCLFGFNGLVCFSASQSKLLKMAPVGRRTLVSLSIAFRACPRELSPEPDSASGNGKTAVQFSF